MMEPVVDGDGVLVFEGEDFVLPFGRYEEDGAGMEVEGECRLFVVVCFFFPLFFWGP